MLTKTFCVLHVAILCIGYAFAQGDISVVKIDAPTDEPSWLWAPSLPTKNPTKPKAPIKNPTKKPTKKPTKAIPTKKPTGSPSQSPSDPPTKRPTKSPTKAPIKNPTKKPTKSPTKAIPTKEPTGSPSQSPSDTPTKRPTKSPTKAPIKNPTKKPTDSRQRVLPTKPPSTSPTRVPTRPPTAYPTRNPTVVGDTSPITPFKCDEYLGNSTSGITAFMKSDMGMLCTLVEITPQGSLKPAARSYDGFDWEVSPGAYVSLLNFQCNIESCSVNLPVLASGSMYKLTSFEKPSYSRADESARFLEQATFGPTMAAINALTADDLTLSFAKWIKEQQTTVALTSHREFFRVHLNGRMDVSTTMSPVTHPCQAGTRYRRYALSNKDKDRLFITTVGEYRAISMNNGTARSVFDGPITYGSQKLEVKDGSYIICDQQVQHRYGGSVRVKANGIDCTEIDFNGERGNPLVQFTSPDHLPKIVVALSKDEVAPIDTKYFASSKIINQELILTSNLSDPACSAIPELTTNNGLIVFGLYEGDYWIHDPRFELLENTLEKPAADGGGAVVKTTSTPKKTAFSTSCSNVARTFLNEDTCSVSDSANICSPFRPEVENEGKSFVLTIDTTLLRAIYEGTRNTTSATRYFYAVDGLRIQDDAAVVSPCQPSARSRWVRSTADKCNTMTIQPATLAVLSRLLSTFSEKNQNPYILDVFFPQATFTCAPEDLTSIGFTVADLDGNCWLNTHPDHLSVHDFTSWTLSHPGNSPKRNPIKEFAEAGSTTLIFPSWHEMTRWQAEKGRFPSLRRLGDKINYYDLPIEIRTSKFNTLIKLKSGAAVAGPGFNVVCGSENEVANNPSLGGTLDRGAFDAFTRQNKSTKDEDLHRQKGMVWSRIVLEANDQLRQRVAWALAQVIVVSTGAISNGNKFTETFLAYYDIFVRHAFGNYRDILKEVSYSPLMAEMLSFKGSRSTSFVWDSEGILEFPDENYAREIMQLFSVGLFLLNKNGTQIKTKNGLGMKTYSNDEIQEYARLWTGFKPQSERGNIESNNENMIDPMQIDVKWRDPFPKMGLNRKYVGDGIPLCADLPRKHFLAKGATYRLLGKNPTPQLQKDPETWAADKETKRLTLVPSGQAGSLFSKLCGSENPADCNYKAKVVLDTNIACSGAECGVDTVRSVKVADDIFYEYVRPPCVYQAFYANAQTLADRYGTDSIICADPRVEAASTACCDDSSLTSSWDDEYWGERTLFATAMTRCDEKLCSRGIRPSCNKVDNPSVGSSCDDNHQYWTQSPCSLRVKVNEIGNAAIVHAPWGVADGDVSKLVNSDVKIFFRVDWTGNVSSLVSQCETISSCERTLDGLCTCAVSVSENRVFADGESPSSNDILALPIGAFDPQTNAKADSYTSKAENGVVWHMLDGKVDSYTIFEVVDDAGVTRFRKNLYSTVKLMNLDLSFRNPVHIVSLSDPEVRDAHFETDAALDHYFYHPNTAPFLAIRFAQRFGISNPSPRYIESISNAFVKGSYSSVSADGSRVEFGSGKYGDLAAMVACVLLDREARNTILDADASHGHMKEPLMKVIGLMRSMEFKLFNNVPFVVFRSIMHQLIGQMAHEIPDVFSYFKPEDKPSGPVTQASLVAPEGIVTTGSSILSLLNGLFSLIKYGFSTCYEGFAASSFRVSTNCGNFAPGKYSLSHGRLTFAPSETSPAAVIDELATLMTAGRLSPENRKIVEEVYSREQNSTLGLINAQQIIATTAEFHATGIMRKTGQARPKPKAPVISVKPYKAVVYLMMYGGFDSYNMLVPHTCTQTNAAGNTVLEQYNEVRGILAFNDTERDRVIDAANQPCDQFVVHPDLEVVEKLYKDGDLAFFANTGVVNRPMTKATYAKVTRSGLFAHNMMQEEAQKIDPFDRTGATGFLGRMCDILTEKGFSTKPITIQEASLATLGLPGKSPSVLAVSSRGATVFNPRTNNEIRQGFDPQLSMQALHAETDMHSSILGETWSSRLQTALDDNAALSQYLASYNLTMPFGTDDFSTRLGTTARLIATHAARGSDREVFFTNLKSWDHHSDMKNALSKNFKMLNTALTGFSQEMKQLGLWENVTVVIVSDFARTLTPNSGLGSDHGWGGNYFVMGGSVKGGQIHGQYPQDITDDGPVNIGRGRLMPTSSWETMVNSVAGWMGLDSETELNRCMPNRLSTGTRLYSNEEVFKTGKQ